MLSFGLSRARRVRSVICALALLALPATAAVAGPIHPAGSMEGGGSDPFGRPTSALPDGALQEKWRTVAREIEAEGLVLALCQEDRARCESTAALQFLAIVDSAAPLRGRARLGHINRAINLAIRPASDLALYGDVDVWSSPLATLAKGAGDCEDYAIAKLVALRTAGIELNDLRLTILHDARRAQDHAVVAARLDGHWLILDNQRLVMLEDNRLEGIQPMFSIDQTGVRQYLDMTATRSPAVEINRPQAQPASVSDLDVTAGLPGSQGMSR
ncbi:MAG: transglutaminase-like cysteine peptidase [Rhodopseudomonas sp.]|uniref:transglutaminase-like cysteine peptidase n=1 Tax=Rhodopseudomonas sp. TaxID=1078 RepID=UPI00183CA57F|nr:transglutaminase-like cysteine peptidase [Rhodopseudomonas sp.]NVN87779.1 transglutaminase-like cysteine peptidase [Rhodopseudomonas sp.]